MNAENNKNPGSRNHNKATNVYDFDSSSMINCYPYCEIWDFALDSMGTMV